MSSQTHLKIIPEIKNANYLALFLINYDLYFRLILQSIYACRERPNGFLFHTYFKHGRFVQILSFRNIYFKI